MGQHGQRPQAAPATTEGHLAQVTLLSFRERANSDSTYLSFVISLLNLSLLSILLTETTQEKYADILNYTWAMTLNH